MTIDYLERIPNNVDLSENRRLRRALEAWQPKYLEWWRETGPEGFLAKDVYLRTAISVDKQGWANFGFVKMPDYRWARWIKIPFHRRLLLIASSQKLTIRKMVVKCAGHSGLGGSFPVTFSPHSARFAIPAVR